MKITKLQWILKVAIGGGDHEWAERAIKRVFALGIQEDDVLCDEDEQLKEYELGEV